MAHMDTAIVRTRRRSQLGEGLEGARSALNRARHVPGYIYTSPEIFQREKENIFMKDWLCVARVEEVENPGDFMTFRIMGEPAVVARDRDGKLNAFANVCAHRGVEVASGEGNTEAFMCLYHGWTYDLAGRLTGAAFMKEAEGFDPATCRLTPLGVGVWAGWIFITFNQRAEPLDEFVAVYEQDFALLKMEECRLVKPFKHTLDLECNWKLVIENFIDFYHFGTIHANTLMRRMSSFDIPYYLRRRGGYLVFYDSGPQTPDGKSLFGKMPWLEDKPESFAISGLLTPNFNIFARVDNVRPGFIWPLSPNRTRLIYYPLIPKQHFETMPDLEKRAAVYNQSLVATLEEDRAMVQSLQHVMSSWRFRPGPLSRVEQGVHHIINYHLDMIFGEP